MSLNNGNSNVKNILINNNISYVERKDMPGWFCSEQIWIEFEAKARFHLTQANIKIICPDISEEFYSTWLNKIVCRLSSYPTQISVINPNNSLTPYEEKLHASFI
jgi:hypothetical protein